MTFLVLLVIGITVSMLVYFGFIIWQTQKEFNKIHKDFNEKKQDMSWMFKEMDKLKESQKKNKK
jgi:flagellar basal body-associated protein FliL